MSQLFPYYNIRKSFRNAYIVFEMVFSRCYSGDFHFFERSVGRAHQERQARKISPLSGWPIVSSFFQSLSANRLVFVLYDSTNLNNANSAAATINIIFSLS